MNTKGILEEFDWEFHYELVNYNSSEFPEARLKKFIISKIETQQHDNEILVNTILEDNKRKIKEVLEEIVIFLKGGMKNEKLADEKRIEGYVIALEIINNKFKELE